MRWVGLTTIYDIKAMSLLLCPC